MGLLRAPDGTIVNVPDDQEGSARAGGYEPLSLAEAGATTGAATQEDTGALGAARASASGVLSGLTLGASDLGLQALMSKGQLADLQQAREQHPFASAGGEFLGALLPGLLSEGATAGASAEGLGARILAHTPAAGVSRVGGAITGLGEGAGLLGRTAASAAGAGAEGALYGGGQYLSQTALEDKPLSAEGFVGAMGHGALFAAPVGGVLTLGEGALIRARSLFPRSEVTAAAASGVKQEATGSLAQAVSDGDTMAALAERRLSDVEARAAQAQSGEQVTRRVFGGADPQAVADQAAAGVERTELAAALRDQQAAKAQLADWIATEADPDLERALQGLQSGNLQTPVLPAATGAAPHFPSPGDRIVRPAFFGSGTKEDIVDHIAIDPTTGDRVPMVKAAHGFEPVHDWQWPRPTGPTVPVGEFGAPGAPGLRRGEDLIPRPPTAVEAPTGQATAVGKLKPRAEGTPVEVQALAPETPPTRFSARGYGAARTGEDFTSAGSAARRLGGEVPAAEIVAQGRAAEAAAENAAGPAIEHMSTEQLDTLQDHLDKARGEHTPQSREYVELSQQWDRAVARRQALQGGTAAVHEAGKLSTPPALSEDEFEALYKPWRAQLPSDIEKSMQTYAANGAFSHINGGLRSGEKLSPQLERIAEDIDRGIASSQLPREATLFRGVSGRRSTQQWNAAAVGDEIVDPAFGSTSTMEHVGGGYSKGFGARPGVELRITTPKGFPAAPIPSETFASERELLLPRGTKYKVTAIQEGANGRTIYVTASHPSVAESAGAVKAAGASDTLTGLLRGTREKLGGGQSLKEIGAPSIAEYAADKAKRTSEAAQHFRAQAIAKRDIPAYDALKAHEGKVDGPLEQTLPANRIAERGYYEPPHEVPVPGGGYTPIPIDDVAMQNARKAIAEGQRDAIKLNVSPTGKITVTDGRHRLAAAIEADAPIKVKWSTGFEPAGSDVLRSGRSAGKPEPMSALGAEGGATAPSKVEPAQQTRGLGKAIIDSARRDRTAGAVSREDITTTLVKRSGKNVDIGPGLARAAKAIGDVEAANARLVNALGSEAPATAVTHAKAYQAAVRAQADASASSSAKAAADIKGKLQPALNATTPPPGYAEAQMAVEGRMATELEKARARLAAHAPTPEPAAAPGAAAPPPPAARGRSPLGAAADVGSALEILHALGVHTPAISAIPVIGPILGLFLKARAVLGILGRKGGSIGRSTEGLIASKSAATRERINAATGAILEGAAKGAGKAASAAGPAALLAGRLFPGGDEPKGDDPVARYHARLGEIARAMAPGAIDQAISERYQTSDPALHDALVAQVERGIKFLDGKAPKPVILPGMLPGDGTWQPSKAALEEFGKYVHAVNDPASVLEDLAKGVFTAEGAETLRVVYPGLFAQAQRALIEAAPKMQTTLPYPRRVAISIMYQVPVDITMTPGHMQFLRPSAGPSIGPPSGPPSGPPPMTPAMTGPIKLGQQTMTPLDHRAGM